jgi:hypothetical protein
MAGMESTMVGVPNGNGSKDITIPVQESSQWLDYIQEQSFNLKTVLDHYEVNVESITYDKKKDNIIVRENTGVPGVKRTAIIRADEYIRKEVSNMFSRL